jgi:glycosidase
MLPVDQLSFSLATDTEYVRAKLAAYANDLISLGVDGFRLDAAKHQNPKDIANVLSRLSKKVYITQETIYGANVCFASSCLRSETDTFSAFRRAYNPTCTPRTEPRKSSGTRRPS